jgi:hypothetical protein
MIGMLGGVTPSLPANRLTSKVSGYTCTQTEGHGGIVEVGKKAKVEVADDATGAAGGQK